MEEDPPFCGLMLSGGIKTKTKTAQPTSRYVPKQDVYKDI